MTSTNSQHPHASYSDIVFTLSAPGKVILHGEHSVVHGKLALAGSLDLRTSLTFKENSKADISPGIELDFSDIDLHIQLPLKEIQALLDKALPTRSGIILYNFKYPEKIDHDLHLKNTVEYLSQNEITYNLNQVQKNALATFLYMVLSFFACLNIKLTPIIISVSSQLSLGAGTGSSASFVVCIVAALLHYIKIRLLSVKMENVSKIGYAPVVFSDTFSCASFSDEELQLISDWSFLGEKIHHGNPSGIDNVICTFGSMVAFQKGSKPIKLYVSHPLKIMLINSMVSRETKPLVAKVQEFKEKRPSIFKYAMESIDGITRMALDNFEVLNHTDQSDTISRNLFNILEGLFEMNHLFLDMLGVSHPSLEDIISILKRYGLKGKLTGAGGGGYAIALIPPHFKGDDNNKLIANLKDNGFDARTIILSANGVRVEDDHKF